MSNMTMPTNDGPLRNLLREARPAPPLPPRFQEAVWRRIESAEAPAETASLLSRLDLWVERLLRPRVALAGLVALLLVGAAAGALGSAAQARQAAQERYLAAVAPHAVH